MLKIPRLARGSLVLRLSRQISHSFSLAGTSSQVLVAWIPVADSVAGLAYLASHDYSIKI